MLRRGWYVCAAFFSTGWLPPTRSARSADARCLLLPVIARDTQHTAALGLSRPIRSTLCQCPWRPPLELRVGQRLDRLRRRIRRARSNRQRTLEDLLRATHAWTPHRAAHADRGRRGETQPQNHVTHVPRQLCHLSPRPLIHLRTTEPSYLP